MNSDRTKRNYYIYCVVISVNLISFSTGNAYSWASPALPKLLNPEENPLARPISTVEQSLLASFLSLSAAFSPILAGISSDRLGRKKTLLMFAVPMLIAQILFAFSTLIHFYLLGRLLWGIGNGCVFCVLPNYVSEVSEDHNRGILGCLMAACITLGNVYNFTIGPYVNMTVLSFVEMVPIVMFLLVFGGFMPESPHYWASIGEHAKAKQSLQKLRTKSKEELCKELEGITKYVEESNATKGGVRDLFRTRGCRRALFIINGLMVFQQFSGINAVLSYMQIVFNAAGTTLPPEVSVMIIGIIQWIATVVTAWVIEQLGRRLLMMISTTGSCLSLLALGIYFYLQTNGFNVDSVWWLPIASLIVFIIAFNVGLGGLPWIIMGELFPSNLKSAAATLTTCLCLFLAFFITLVFPLFADLVGMAATFWFFCGCSMVGTLFTFFVLPETTGKSLQEIQRLLNKD